MSDEYYPREIKAGAIPISAPIAQEFQRGAVPPTIPVIQAVLPSSPVANPRSPTPPPLPPPAKK